jgi:hypothetical protein
MAEESCRSVSVFTSLVEKFNCYLHRFFGGICVSAFPAFLVAQRVGASTREMVV